MMHIVILQMFIKFLIMYYVEHMVKKSKGCQFMYANCNTLYFMCFKYKDIHLRNSTEQV